MTAPRSVLVVDDVAEILHLFERFAETDGDGPLDVVALSDPAAALVILGERSFDIVVSDYRMPLVDGIRVLSAARAHHPEGRRVLMTGYNEIPASTSQIDPAGLSARLKKPVRFASLQHFFHACFSDDPRALAAYDAAEAG